MKRALMLVLLSVSGCLQSTGGQLVSFSLTASGDPAVVTGGPLTFTTPRGFEVTLTKAQLTVGAVYFNQQNPQNYTLDQSCVQTGVYTGEVRGGLTVDLLSPVAQPFPVEGNGTDRQTLAAELWLTGGDILATSDNTVVLSVRGTATQGTTNWPFAADFTISQNRAIPPRNTALPGSNPLCQQRIVAPISFSTQLAQGSVVQLLVDPRQYFGNVDFASLSRESETPLLYRFADSTNAGPDVQLYTALRNAGVGGPYRFDVK